VGSNPTYSLGSGGLIGYCNTVPSTLSTTATIGDSVIWSGIGNRLILQSSAASAGLYLDSSNNAIFNNNVSINGTLTCNTMNIITLEVITGDTPMYSSLFVSGISILQNALMCLSSLTVSGNTTFKSSIYINGNDNKVLSVDANRAARLGFLKQFGVGP
jgi:hypothetical protein